MYKGNKKTNFKALALTQTSSLQDQISQWILQKYRSAHLKLTKREKPIDIPTYARCYISENQMLYSSLSAT